MAFNIHDVDWGALEKKAKAVAQVVEVVLADLKPVEEVLPLPPSVKTVVDDLTAWVGDLAAMVSKLQ